MKIAILSRKSSLYSTRRLREACIDRGHEVEVIDYLRCYMNIATKRPTITYGMRDLNEFDAIIPRVGASHTFYGAAVVRQFDMMNAYVINTATGISQSRDKLRALQLLGREGIGMPVTAFGHSFKDVDGIIRSVGGAPLVIKVLEGTQGIGVVLAETKKAAQSVIEAFMGLDVNFLVQEFIREAGGADIRAFVVGDEVVAAMQRQAPEGEFRSNVHRGGVATAIDLTDEERETAVLSAKIMGLNMAGVDMMRSERGPLVLEVNSSPGLEGIERSSGVDVAQKVVEFIEKKVDPLGLKLSPTVVEESEASEASDEGES
ncbi:30S ribosomal protein S6--L-glutamate ligase [Bradymonas sediminis]|uniref:Probable alpha-L-glutamate ligase n=1 Tax=Bradymonas sediminis TaxID=1548548 RepID=A0A2Z4FQP7_9DELT|nr:30S ribosomal protein S6--L-glutamate ligase [Bradymonas sediminis]AWV91283.1 30S ribosomal protein S6--L-glutamate ligase [Bradymonas sediminis]TDP73855.1 SSU ribosomal protein S6P modification protein [Bradymonas sediminis]